MLPSLSLSNRLEGSGSARTFHIFNYSLFRLFTNIIPIAVLSLFTHFLPISSLILLDTLYPFPHLLLYIFPTLYSVHVFYPSPLLLFYMLVFYPSPLLSLFCIRLTIIFIIDSHLSSFLSLSNLKGDHTRI